MKRNLNPRTVALTVIALATLFAIGAALGESFHGLYLWADGHDLGGLSALGFPLLIDTFIIGGEAALYLASHEGWRKRDRILPWLSVAGGLAASVALNTGRDAIANWTTHVTFAIPPLAAAAMLMISLSVLKHVKSSKARKVAPEKIVPKAAPAPAPATSSVDMRRAPLTPPRKPRPAQRAFEPVSPEKRARFDAYLADLPGATTNELAKHAGVSWATADKWRKEPREPQAWSGNAAN